MSLLFYDLFVSDFSWLLSDFAVAGLQRADLLCLVLFFLASSDRVGSMYNYKLFTRMHLGENRGYGALTGLLIVFAFFNESCMFLSARRSHGRTG